MVSRNYFFFFLIVGIMWGVLRRWFVPAEWIDSHLYIRLRMCVDAVSPVQQGESNCSSLNQTFAVCFSSPGAYTAAIFLPSPSLEMKVHVGLWLQCQCNMFNPTVQSPEYTMALEKQTSVRQHLWPNTGKWDSGDLFPVSDGWRSDMTGWIDEICQMIGRFFLSLL